MNEQVEAVNRLLKAGEPGNISVDEHTNYTGYKPQAIIDAMNEVLWGQWGFEEVSSDIVPGDKGALAVAQVRVWLKDVVFQPVGWGQNRVTRGDIGDARKGAQTDAIKKALSYFSIGNRAYHGLLDKKKSAGSSVHTSDEASTPDQPQTDTVKQLLAKARTRALALKFNKAQWESLRLELSGKGSDDLLTLADIAKINGELTNREKQAQPA